MPRLAMASALFALAGAPSAHAAGTGGLSHGGAATHDAVVTDVADAGTLGAYRAVPGGKVPYAIDADPLPDGVDGDSHVDGTNRSTSTAFGMSAVPIRSVPEPSELALLGDGLLVLIAWLAGRQARRSRSMAAMTDRDEP